MKIFFCILIIGFLPLKYLYSIERPDFLNKAIMFQVSNLGPDNFKGGVGFQYSVNPDFSLRIPMGFKYFNEFTQKPGNTEVDKNTDEFSISFSPGIKYNLIKQTNLNIYTGFEILIQIDNTYTTGDNFKDNEVNKYSRTIGAAWFLGVELFVYKNVSISAEYSLKLSTISGENEYIVGSISQKDKLPTQTSFTAGINNTNFILSFYFN